MQNGLKPKQLLNLDATASEGPFRILMWGRRLRTGRLIEWEKGFLSL